MDRPDYSELTYEEAVELLPNVNEDWFKANAAFAAGDHWQDGDGWTGPSLESDHALKATTDSFIEKIFTTEDMIGDIIDRHASGACGKTIKWAMIERISQEETANG
jgi:hypothetical protein